MARLFPATLDGVSVSQDDADLFTLAGATLLPDEDHWGWLRPTLSGKGGARRPSLVLLGPGYGLLVLSVASFGPEAVVEEVPRGLIVRRASVVPQRVPHPEIEAAEAAAALGRRLAEVAPVSGWTARWGVAFPHLSAMHLEGLRRRGVAFTPGKSLTRDDWTPGRFRNALERLGAPLPPEALAPSGRARIRIAVEPQLHFLDLRDRASTPPESGASPRAESAPRIAPAPGFWLDRKQERMARELASPRTLVIGPAGSGKTVFLASRAQYWLDRRPESRVLFTCYNASLASHLRGVLAARGVPPDGERLTVKHYHDLCGSLLEIEAIHERPPSFYAALEPKLLAELSRREDLPGFDLILVDEGQDFTLRMMEVLIRLNAPGGEITVVCDPAQDIYGRWSASNLAPLRDPAVEHLVDCYRNTAPIFSLALGVLTPAMRESLGFNRLELTRPEDLGREGPPPEMRPLSGLDDLIALIVDAAAETGEAGLPASELAVLYTDRNAIPGFFDHVQRSSWSAARDPRYQIPAEDEDPFARDIVQGTLHPTSDRDDIPPSDHPHFAEALERELLARNLPVEWVARDFPTKAAYDIAKPRSSLSTIHSAKGMDFHTVILLGVEGLSAAPTREGERARSLLFTGITRARERLVIPYFDATGWVPGIAELLNAE